MVYRGLSQTNTEFQQNWLSPLAERVQKNSEACESFADVTVHVHSLGKTTVALNFQQHHSRLLSIAASQTCSTFEWAESRRLTSQKRAEWRRFTHENMVFTLPVTVR